MQNKPSTKRTAVGGIILEFTAIILGVAHAIKGLDGGGSGDLSRDVIYSKTHVYVYIYTWQGTWYVILYHQRAYIKQSSQ